LSCLWQTPGNICCLDPDRGFCHIAICDGNLESVLFCNLT
jgi:hypothetical protein